MGVTLDANSLQGMDTPLMQLIPHLVYSGVRVLPNYLVCIPYRDPCFRKTVSVLLSFFIFFIGLITFGYVNFFMNFVQCIIAIH